MPNEELRERNRKEVLRQAIACFMEHGIEASTLSNIAARSGVTKRSILRYYKTKDQLIEQVIGELLDTTYASLHAYLNSDEYRAANGMTQLMNVFDMRAQFTKENPHIILCLTELEVYFTKRMRNLEVYRHYYASFGFLATVVENAISKGLEDGSIRCGLAQSTAADLIAIGYKGLLQRMCLIYANQDLVKEYDPDKLIASFRTLIVSMLEP